MDHLPPRAFDFVLLEISHAALERAIEEKEGRRVRGLVCVAGVRDEVLVHLAGALTPALEKPAGVSLLFVDQVGVAIASYLVETYGGAATAKEPKTNRFLSRPGEMQRHHKGVLRRNLLLHPQLIGHAGDARGDEGRALRRQQDQCGRRRQLEVPSQPVTVGALHARGRWTPRPG